MQLHAARLLLVLERELAQGSLQAGLANRGEANDAHFEKGRGELREAARIGQGKKRKQGASLPRQSRQRRGAREHEEADGLHGPRMAAAGVVEELNGWIKTDR